MAQQCTSKPAKRALGLGLGQSNNTERTSKPSKYLLNDNSNDMKMPLSGTTAAELDASRDSEDYLMSDAHLRKLCN